MTTVSQHSGCRVDGTHRTVFNALDASLKEKRLADPAFELPMTAEDLVKYAREHVANPKRGDGRVKNRPENLNTLDHV